MTEFALVLPVLLGAGLMGLEAANQAIIQMKVNQIAVQVADNASRIGDTSFLASKKIYESDINDVFTGANILGGSALDIFENGRVIVSSLEVVPGQDDDQYFHWQRCKGVKNHTSRYGAEGFGAGGGFKGVGPSGEEVRAYDDEAVIYVEISYDYQPVVSSSFSFAETISASASFTVRDKRDITQIYQRNSGSPDPIASCDVFDGFAVAS
ncbi:hypothetical protein [Altererythrobacter aquiaggeris]|uniref:TadE/TadG family type IV pilus assembly protein n=1 Tax=Aestuarierythrobacter aquiaggeris TaxID=1898396 RepID=UPI00301666D3